MPEILRERLAAPSNWRGSELGQRASWTHELSSSEIDELLGALESATASGRTMLELERSNFPLRRLKAAIAGWMQELECGRGFVNVRGIPIDRVSDEQAALLLWGLGLHMGTAVSQNAAGDRLGHVRDTGADPADPSVRLYKTRVELAFHSDGADVVALMCLRQGQSGGSNRFVSTAALYDEIRQRRPDLVPLLYQPWYWDRNEEQAPGEPPFFALPICRYQDGNGEQAAQAGHGGRLSFFYIPWYIRGAQRHSDVPRLTSEQHELLDLIDGLAAEPWLHLEMRLEPGEINLLKNNTALHARTEYVDFEAPERKRHLLRLWLSAHGEWTDSDAFVQQGIPAKPGVETDAVAIERADSTGGALA